jgi:hypothetical protein
MNRNWIVRVLTFMLPAVLVLPSAAFASPKLVKKELASKFANRAQQLGESAGEIALLSSDTIVDEGDWIQFDPSSKQVVTIKWQQDLGNRQETYIALPYSVKGKEASGSLFIQQDLADSFFQKCQTDESINPLVSGGYKIQVDKAFQYGQDNYKTLRFLVYHNKANKPYQHRFIETTAFSNIGKRIIAAGREWGSQPWQDLGQRADLLRSFIGDYLRDF